MWDFIVSGYIPGTEIQVTFTNIVLCAVAVLFVAWRIVASNDSSLAVEAAEDEMVLEDSEEDAIEYKTFDTKIVQPEDISL